MTLEEFNKAFDEVLKQVKIEHPEWLNPEMPIPLGIWKEMIEKEILKELKEYERISKENIENDGNQARQV